MMVKTRDHSYVKFGGSEGQFHRRMSPGSIIGLTSPVRIDPGGDLSDMYESVSSIDLFSELIYFDEWSSSLTGVRTDK